MTEAPWSEIDHAGGCLPIRWRQEFSHALTFQFLDEPDDEAVYEVDVKWDGCINWKTVDDQCAHFCEPADLDRLAATFRRAWRITGDVLQTALKEAFDRKAP